MADSAKQDKVAQGDNQWVPTNATIKHLASEGYQIDLTGDTAKDVEQLNKMIVERDNTDARICVYVYALSQRSYDDADIVAFVNNALSLNQVRTAKRDGRVIVTSATPKASVDAVRKAKLSYEKVNEATQSTDKEANAEQLLRDATSDYISKNQQWKKARKTADPKDAKKISVDKVDPKFDEIAAFVDAKEQAPTVANLAAAATEILNTEPKQRETKGPEQPGAMQPHVHLKQAREDAKAIAESTTGKGSKYPMTADDVTALAQFLKSVEWGPAEREGLFDLIANELAAISE